MNASSVTGSGPASASPPCSCSPRSSPTVSAPDDRNARRIIPRQRCGLILPFALTTRGSGRPAALVIGRVVVVRVAGIAALGTVANTLIAFAVDVAASRGAAGGDGGVRQRHRGRRQGVAMKRSACDRDGRARENR